MALDFQPDTTHDTSHRVQWLHSEMEQLQRDLAEMTARAELLSAWTASLGADVWAEQRR